MKSFGNATVTDPPNVAVTSSVDESLVELERPVLVCARALALGLECEQEPVLVMLVLVLPGLLRQAVSDVGVHSGTSVRNRRPALKRCRTS